MPTYKDSKGESRFSMNPQVGKAKFGSGEKSPKESAGAKTEKPAEHHSGGSSVTLHDHGDGTYHTEHGDGTQVEHPHLGHALTHLAHHHEPSGKHVHVHSEGGYHSAHTVDENGNQEGPHDHQNIEELKNHMDQFLNEESHEGEGQGGEYEAEGGNDSGDSTGLSHLMA